jgi:anaerobic ribonucleoside-triphosphate reductase
MVIGDSHYSTITERVKVCKKGGYYGNKIERRGNVEFFLRAV